jgi:hypothetical protein
VKITKAEENRAKRLRIRMRLADIMVELRQAASAETAGMRDT